MISTNRRMQKIAICLTCFFFKNAFCEEESEIILLDVIDVEDDHDPNLKDSSILSIASNTFGVDLYKYFPEKKNLLYSPISISSALGMLCFGARGRTEEEMRKALGYDRVKLDAYKVSQTFQRFFFTIGSSYSGNILEIWSSVLLQKDFSLQRFYETIISRSFKGSLKHVDFALDGLKITRETNQWVKEKTHNKTYKILMDEPSSDTLLYLLNIAYFNGTWFRMFSDQQTVLSAFYNFGEKSKKTMVPMMHTQQYFNFSRQKEFTALQLPYKGQNINLLMILPDDLDGLNEIEKFFTADTFLYICSTYKMHEVEVSMPKFKIECDEELSDALVSFGMKSAFSQSADYSGISPKSGLQISRIVHKSYLEVHDQFMEGPSDSGVQNVLDERIKLFIVDHPFMFVIYDASCNLILFLGRVNQL